MEPQSDQPPLIVIVGETASGKSALALTLAKQFGGEIIAADSRTVYKGMDIGTAKPTAAERQAIPHHLLDVVSPDQRFTVADFKHLTEKAIQDISSRGRIPFLVGGTGLYVDAVLYDFSFREKPDERQRQHLQSLTVDDLQALLSKQAISLPVNERNPRHLIRAIEAKGAPGLRRSLRPNTLVLGLGIDRNILTAKVAKRVDFMVEQGLVDEVKRISEQYGWDAPALLTPGYKAFRLYLAGQLNREQAKELVVRNHLQLAKRQRTWFKRNKSIHWISKRAEAVDLVTTFLNK